MDFTAIIGAAIAAVPATVAAMKAHTCCREIRRVRSMLSAHLSDPNAHRDARPVRAVNTRREGGGR